MATFLCLGHPTLKSYPSRMVLRCKISIIVSPFFLSILHWYTRKNHTHGEEMGRRNLPNIVIRIIYLLHDMIWRLYPRVLSPPPNRKLKISHYWAFKKELISINSWSYKLKAMPNHSGKCYTNRENISIGEGLELRFSTVFISQSYKKVQHSQNHIS